MMKSVSRSASNVADNFIAFTAVKISVVLVNLMHICFVCYVIYLGINQLNDRESTEEDPKKLEMLELNKTVLIISSIMAFLLCMTGIIGAILESYGCIVGYTIVLTLALLVTLIQPARSKPMNLTILVAMTGVALSYALMLKARETKAEQRQSAAHAAKANAYVVQAGAHEQNDVEASLTRTHI